MAKIIDPTKPVVEKKGGGRGKPVELVPSFTEIVIERCKVCKSPYRREIDHCLLTGWSQAAIIRHFNQLIDDPTMRFKPQNMSVHARKHLSAKDAMARRIIEARALQSGLSLEEAVETVLTRAAFLDTVVHRTLVGMEAGQVQPEVKDAITAIKELEALEQQQNAALFDKLRMEFSLMLKCMKEEPAKILAAMPPGLSFEEQGELIARGVGEAFKVALAAQKSKPTQIVRGLTDTEIKGLPAPESDIDDAEFEEVEE